MQTVIRKPTKNKLTVIRNFIVLTRKFNLIIINLNPLDPIKTIFYYHRLKFSYNTFFYINYYIKKFYVILVFDMIPLILIIIINIKSRALILFMFPLSPSIRKILHILFRGTYLEVLCNFKHNIYYKTNKVFLHFQDLFLFTYCAQFLCNLFFKRYKNFYSYRDYPNMFFVKNSLYFIPYKEVTFMEYQVNFEASFSYYKDLFNHVKKQLLSMGHVFSSLRVDVYLFLPNRQIPRRINIYFHRVRSLSALTYLFSKAYASFISYHDDDRYELDEKSHNISFRLHFIKIPVKTETLEMQPFNYYERVNIAHSLFPFPSKKKAVVVAMQVKKKRKDFSASLAKQTLVSSDYFKEDFDFIF